MDWFIKHNIPSVKVLASAVMMVIAIQRWIGPLTGEPFFALDGG
jgi:hypothetical protein